jgi:hypothetical protein
MPPCTASVFGGNLGDTLWVTALARYEPNVVVVMRAGDAKAESTSEILRYQCARVFENSPAETRKAAVRAHVTQQILTAYGHGGKPSIPRVILQPKEIEAAVKLLKTHGYTPDSIAIVNHNSANGDPTNYRAHYVRPPSEVMHKLAAFHARGGRAKIFQFGPTESYYTWDPFDPIPGAIHIRGLSVRELAACYHVIGKLISGDTGDYHLMLAVGGKVACLVPPHSDQLGYRHWDLLYDGVCWGDERPRVRYALHSDWTQFLDTDLFRSIDAPPST